MTPKKPKPKRKPASREKFVKVEETYEELVAKSFAAKRPPQGWPKPPKK